MPAATRLTVSPVDLLVMEPTARMPGVGARRRALSSAAPAPRDLGVAATSDDQDLDDKSEQVVEEGAGGWLQATGPCSAASSFSSCCSSPARVTASRVRWSSLERREEEPPHPRRVRHARARGRRPLRRRRDRGDRGTCRCHPCHRYVGRRGGLDPRGGPCLRHPSLVVSPVVASPSGGLLTACFTGPARAPRRRCLTRPMCAQRVPTVDLQRTYRCRPVRDFDPCFATWTCTWGSGAPSSKSRRLIAQASS